MQYHWLNKQNNKNLIIFFGGWSFDYKPFECFDCKDYDVLMFYDYTNLELPENICSAENYENISLIGWSMGVFAAYCLKDKLPKFNDTLAINGTPYPVDDNLGIPHRTFNLTLQYAETGLQGKFYKNVFSNDEFLAKYNQSPVERSIKNRVDELISLDSFIKSRRLTYDNSFYNRAIVGLNDKIIPAKNQLNCWKDIAIKLDCGHFPFYNFAGWDEILKCK